MIRVLFAEIISLSLHPILFFTIMPFLIIYRETASEAYALKWAIFSAAFIFFTGCIIIVGRLRGTYSDFDLSRKEERILFYRFLIPLLFVYLFLVIYFRGVFFSISIVTSAIIFSSVVFAMINVYVKASVHTAVACAYVITLGILYGTTAFWLSFWIVPAVIWARLVLKRHTISEVLTGGVFGSLVTFGTFLISKQIII